METQNESILDSYAEDSSNLSDSSVSPESDSVSDPSDVTVSFAGETSSEDSEQGSETDSTFDGSSLLVGEDSESYTVMDKTNSDIVYELQRIEGYEISILNMLYIAFGLFCSVVIVRMIYHFTKFD